ncbi:ATP-binding protein [Sutcliffiella deserti]|uniref:ATP-binding protein n=1 Tax=Sutcliffiella deserti TaxID=2875501 RepID=UPI001CBDD5D1|nr:AAA family ATPase [Sutcliffiella deserti]
MKLIEVEIYGFGKLENVKIDFLSEKIQVFYGSNEAGKSTLMAFIQAILFGFPTRNQADLRYEPKKGFKYGGKLKIESHDGCILTIERIAGKAIGDVRVWDVDGNDYPLNRVLEGMDKSIFKGIFSFNIMDVQNLKLIDVEQLGGYLFSSGLIGTDQLLKLSGHLVKSQDDLFKPSGRKPAINRLLKELREEEKIVYKWREKLEQYETLQTKIQDAEEKLQTISLEKSKLSLRVRQVEAMLVMQPIYDQLERVDYELAKLGDYRSFPVDGLARLEKMLTERNLTCSKLEKLEEENQALNEEIQLIKVNTSLLELEERLNDLTEKFPKYQQAAVQVGLLEIEQRRLESQIDSFVQELNWEDYSEQEILEVDTNLQSKATLKELLNTQQLLSHQKQGLDEQFQQAKNELEYLEERIASLEKEQMTPAEINQLHNEAAEQSTENMEKEITLHEQLLSQLESQLDFQTTVSEKSKKLKRLSGGASMIIGIFGGISFFLQGNMLLGLSVFILASIIGAFLFFSNPQNSLASKLQRRQAELKEKLEGLKEKLYSNPKRENINRVQLKIAKEERLQEFLQKDRLLLSQSERVYDKIIRQFEEWEKDRFKFEEKCAEWTRDRYLQSIPFSYVEEAFENATQIKASIIEKTTVESKIKVYTAFIHEFETEINQLMIKGGFTLQGVEEAFYFLKRQSKEHQELQSVKNNLIQKRDEKLEESNLLSLQWKEACKRIDIIMKQAHAQTEEDFRVKDQEYQRAMALEQKRQLLDSQLKQMEKSYNTPIEKGKTYTMWEEERNLLDQELNTIKEEETLLFQSKTRDREVIRTLEEGGTFSDAIQKFELSKSKLQDYARKWAVYATAQQLLLKTMEYYRTVKLPEVLEKASRNFRFLTEENYLRVYDSHNEPTLMVEHKDGLSFEPKELSQATVESLYISLRFAVASVWSKEHHFPYMLDDCLVNFDAKRTSQALNLLQKLSDEGEQILFFTCHEHMKVLFEKQKGAKVYSLELTAAPNVIG